MDIERTERVIKAREHPLKVKLLQLLSIYTELSTSEIVERSGRSKPTVLKHLKELEKLGEVSIKSVVSPGAYDKNIYSIVRGNYTIKGQNLHSKVLADPKFAIEYNNYKLSDLLLLKDIIDSMVIYQKRLGEQVENSLDNPNNILQLMKDNLGSSSFKYMTRNALFGTGSDKSRDYMEINLTIPIRRIIEQLASKEWKIDGNLWEYD